MPQVLTGEYATLSGALFNATSSEIGFGSAPPSAIAQTTLALIFPTGVAASGSGVIWSRATPTVTDGQRFFITGTGPVSVGFTGSCTGVNNRPFAFGDAASGPISFNVWWHVAATWSGSSSSTGIILYAGNVGQPLQQRSVSTSTSGSGSGTDVSGSTYSFMIGAFPTAASTFKGTIAYVARWNRVLTLAELQQAQRLGPLTVPLGLIVCWANGRDYSPYNPQPTSQTAIAAGMSPTFSQRMIGRPFRKQWVTGGGSRVRASNWLFGA